MNKSTCLVNGQDTDSIPVSDRGLAYGDGLFETIAVKAGQLLLWDEHYRRLKQGCERLKIVPPSSAELLREALSLSAQRERAVIKVIVTRGTGNRGYAVPVKHESENVTRIVQCSAATNWPASNWRQGVKVHVCSMAVSKQPRLAGIKHLNRLEQVLARMEWNDPAISEGLLCDTDEYLVEGVQSNVFWFHGSTLRTPSLDQCGVAGVMREQVMSQAKRLGIAVETGTLHRSALEQTDGMFLTNSLIGIWPVRATTHANLPVPDIVGQLQSAVREVCHAP